MPRNALMDFAQSASNAIAQNVSGPVDLIGSGLRAVGVPVPQNSYGSSQWMEQRGLTKPVPMGAARIAGETFGMAAPTVAAANAAKIAAWHRKVDEVMAQGAKAVGQTAADKAGNYMAQSGLIQPATVWHGSSHKFPPMKLIELPDGKRLYQNMAERPDLYPGARVIEDFPLGRFDSAYIGKGEGAQAYGHGLYFADARGVASTYQGALDASIDGKYFYPSSIEVTDVIQDNARNMPMMREKLMGMLSNPRHKEDARKVISAIDSNSFNVNTTYSNIYKVDLPDEQIAKMLDWDKPLSQQPKAVQAHFEPVVAPIRAGMAKPANSGWGDLAAPQKFDPSGQELLGMLRNRDADLTPQAFLGNGLGPDISARLRQQGIPGIRYLDGGSRAVGTGTSNYVVFPGGENMLKILARNGQELP